MRYVLIMLMLMATASAIIWRTRFLIRLAAVVLMAVFTLVYLNIVNGADGLATRQEFKEKQVMPGSDWRDGARQTEQVLQESNPIALALFACLFVLAIIPNDTRRKSQPPPGN